MERKHTSNEDDSSPEEIAIRINELLKPDSITQADLDTDDYDENVSITEHRRRKPE